MKIVITEALKRRFKSLCAEKGITMSDISVALIEGWIDGRIVLQDSETPTGQDK